jgi:hypothetical protein
VTVDTTGLGVGTYNATITITGSTFNLSVNLSVIEPAKGMRNLPGTVKNPNETYPNATFNVYVNFTAPAHGFNAIGLTDLAPDGWTVEVDVNWSWINGTQNSSYSVDVSSDNQAEIMWAGPFKEGTNISGMYKVTVPTTAKPGINEFPLDNCTEAWLEYYINEIGPNKTCVGGEFQMIVIVPGDMWGETRDVNAAELADVDVQLHLAGPGYLRSDISTPDYVLTACVTGEYWLVVNRTRYHQINASNHGDVPGLEFTIDLSTPALLAAGYIFDFEGNYGLVPKACDLSYVLRSVNLWKEGYPGHSEYNLSEWKVGDVINSWLYPS